MIPYNQSFQLPELEAKDNSEETIQQLFKELKHLQSQIDALKTENYRIKNELNQLTHLIRSKYD